MIIVEKYKHKFFRDISDLGDIYFYLIILIVLLTIKQYTLFIKIFSALVLIYIIAAIIRYFYFNARPTKDKYNNLLEKIDASSFPSLHAGRSVILALYAYFNLPLALSIFIFILTIIIAYTRIYLKRHYISDVIVGAILGIIVFYISNLI